MRARKSQAHIGLLAGYSSSSLVLTFYNSVGCWTSWLVRLHPIYWTYLECPQQPKALWDIKRGH